MNLNKNKLKGNDIKILITQTPKLYKLKIEENKIESPNIFFCLKKLNLRKLSIKGNPVCDKSYLNYRQELFNNIKTLEAIDDIGKNNETIESTEYGDNEDFCEKEDVCGYVYDPELGDPDNGIAPGTAWEDVPEEWVCPVCGVGKTEFTAE